MLDLGGVQLDTKLVCHGLHHGLHVVLVFGTTEDMSLWCNQNVEHVLLWYLNLRHRIRRCD